MIGLIAFLLATTQALRPLHKLPPMGWSSWNKHGCDINEKIIRDTADTMVSSGLAAAGYTFVNVDDCWSAPKRDPITNRLQADPDRFPSGMKALGDYIHSKGLKFGLYSDSGVWTCAFKLGSGNFEQIDAEAFAEWGVDYLKYDNCFTNFFEKASERFAKMSSALKNTSRSIFYSVCNWGQEKAWKWAPLISDSWRISGDIGDLWEPKNALDWLSCPCTTLWCPKVVIGSGHSCSIMNILEKVAKITYVTSERGFTDVDSLEVGNGGMTDIEYESHFSLWAAFRSPLFMGTDLPTASKETLRILTNKEVIKVNQDPILRSVSRIKNVDGIQVWAGPVSDALKVVLVLNTMATTRTIPLTIEDFGIKRSKKHYDLVDLWGGRNKTVSSFFGREFLPHQIWMVKVYENTAYNSTILL